MTRTTSTLTAFGLERRAQPGEALVWSTPTARGAGRVSVAVDVGQADELGRLVAAASPSTLILTHDDEDHIGGWEGFAATGLAALDELWVPYEWDAVVRTMSALAQSAHVQASPGTADVIERLQTGYVLVEDGDGEEDGEEAADGDEIQGDDDDGSARRSDAPPLAEAVDLSLVLSDSERLELGSMVAEDAYWAHLHSATSPTTRALFVGTEQQVAERAIARAHLLQRILLDATRAGVTVQLFSVDGLSDGVRAWATSGSPGTATVANAVPVTPRGAARAAVGDLARLLALSIQNIRALCPVLWHGGGLDGGAIVWSDSPGTWAVADDAAELLTRVTISTAPHHGSGNDAHDDAWIALAPFIARDDTAMLCAGGQWNQTVRPEYSSLPQLRRGCTRCRHVTPRENSRTVAVTSDGATAHFAAADGHCPR